MGILPPFCPLSITPFSRPADLNAASDFRFESWWRHGDLNCVFTCRYWSIIVHYLAKSWSNLENQNWELAFDLMFDWKQPALVAATRPVPMRWIQLIHWINWCRWRSQRNLSKINQSIEWIELWAECSMLSGGGMKVNGINLYLIDRIWRKINLPTLVDCPFIIEISGSPAVNYTSARDTR